MTTSTITSKGQTTIPKGIRERLGVTAGDRIQYVIEPDGRVVILPATRHLQELGGMLKHLAPARPLTQEEMDDAIREGAGG